MLSDSSPGARDGGLPPTTAGRGGNGRVGFGSAANEPASPPAGNGSPRRPARWTSPPQTWPRLWERARLLEDRERIAADLHDHVIQRLSAAALNLHRVMATVGPGPLAAQLEMTVDGLDDTI